jgi:Meckel syndrome type 1 protein
MNTPLPPDRDDQLPGEAELAALYRKLPKSEPSPALDAAVLRAAAEALAAGNDDSSTTANRPPARTWRTHWLIPLASAATLVLAAGLAWHMRNMPAVESSTTRNASPQVAVPVDAPAIVAAPASPPSTMAPAAPQAEAVSPPAMLSEVAQAPHQPAPRMQAKMQGRRMSSLAAMKSKKTAESDVAADALASATVSQFGRENTAAPAPAEPSGHYASAGAVRSMVPASVAETSDASVDKIATTRTRISKAAAVSAAASPSMATPAPAMPATPDVTAKDLHDTPAQELDKIRLLFAAHRDDEAKARLLAFQRGHADQALPADLRARLSGKP